VPVINVIQLKILISRCEGVPHPNAPVMMPGPPIEQYDITYMTKETNIAHGVNDLCMKAKAYAKEIENATSNKPEN
jgi:hypothetical protein